MTTITGDCVLGAWGWVDGLGKAARFSGPSSLALLPSAVGAASEGVLYVSDMANNAVRVLTLAAGAGAAAVNTLVPIGGDAGLRMPSGLAVRRSPPTLFVADYEGGAVKQYTGLAGDAAAALTPVAGGAV